MSSESPTLEPDTLQCSKGCHDTDPLGYHPPLQVGVVSHAKLWPVEMGLLVRIHIVKIKHYTRIFSTKVYVPLGTFHCISLKFYSRFIKQLHLKKIDRIRSGPKLTSSSSTQFPEPSFSRDADVGSHGRLPAPHMQDC